MYNIYAHTFNDLTHGHVSQYIILDTNGYIPYISN